MKAVQYFQNIGNMSPYYYQVCQYSHIGWVNDLISICLIVVGNTIAWSNQFTYILLWICTDPSFFQTGLIYAIGSDHALES